MKLAIAYCRVSSARQVKDGGSLDEQMERIEKFCASRDLDIVARYQDAGLSAKDVKHRPEFVRAMEHVCESKGLLVFYSLSRATRSLKDAFEILERIEGSGAEFMSVTEHFDTTTAQGKLIYGITALFAEHFREQNRERVKASMEYTKAQGRTCGNPPYGWKVGGDGKMLVENEVEQSNIRLIKHFDAQGRTLREIHAYLEAAGIPTRSGSFVWRIETIRKIIKGKT